MPSEIRSIDDIQPIKHHNVGVRRTYERIEDIPTIAECGATEIEYISEPELPCSALVAVTGDAGSGKSTWATAKARDAFRNKNIPYVFLDRENPAAVISDRLARLGTEDGPRRRFWGGWVKEEVPHPNSSIVD